MVASCRTLNYKMRSSSPFIIFLLFTIPVTAFSQWTLPFYEGFDDSGCPDPGVYQCSGPEPDGWSFPGENWRAGDLGEQNYTDTIGYPHPGAYFNYAPTQTNYSHRLITPVISVGDAEGVQVFFHMELNYYPITDPDYNGAEGLSIEYRTVGSGWTEVLSYEISRGSEVSFPMRQDTYTCLLYTSDAADE